MSDYNSRQAAIDALESIGSVDTEIDRAYARGVFEAIPTADVVPVSDCISRQAAINTIQTMYERCDTGDITDYRDMMRESIIVLPSGPEWIPVTERVPALREEVLATDGNYVWCANRVFYQDATLWEDLSSGWTIDGVTAWMPLPEPYTEAK